MRNLWNSSYCDGRGATHAEKARRSEVDCGLGACESGKKVRPKDVGKNSVTEVSSIEQEVEGAIAEGSCSNRVQSTHLPSQRHDRTSIGSKPHFSA